MKRGTVALIDEARCIGCALCIEACPVDAIIGARGLMHTVLDSHCVGCDLCVPPCPVDCIAMVATQLPWSVAQTVAAKRRARQRKLRLAGRDAVSLAPKEQRRSTVNAALERVRERRSAKTEGAA